jgi:hypothetical protein
MGTVLKVLGILFLVIVGGFVALLFWAHGAGEAQQKAFFGAVATGEPDKLIAILDEGSIGRIDPPILKMWMAHVNDKLGKYEGLAASKFNTSTKTVEAGKLVESEGLAKFEKGEAQVRLTELNGKIVGYDITSDALKGDWLKLPVEDPLYRDRAEKLIRNLVDGRLEEALAMCHENLRKNVDTQKFESGMKILAERVGKLQSVKVIKELPTDSKSGKALQIVMLCQFEKDKLLALVRFNFSTICGHILAFDIPCTAEQAGIDPAELAPQE